MLDVGDVPVRSDGVGVEHASVAIRVHLPALHAGPEEIQVADADAVDRVPVQPLHRGDDVEREHAIEPRRCHGTLRILEVRIVQVYADCSGLIRGRRRDARAGLRQVVLVDGERGDSRARAGESHQSQTGVLQRVRDEDEGRRTGEDADVAAKLVGLRAGHVPVEADARRPVDAVLR